MKKQTETELTRAIMAMLHGCGIFCWKHWQGGFNRHLAGIPDIIGIWNGTFIGIEVKSGNNKLTQKQQQWIDRINREGGLAFVARSVDDVIDGLGIRDRFLF
jgi:hypothetical protein